MKLDLIDVFDSPLQYMRQTIWISEKRESFILTDIFKVAEISLSKKIKILSKTKNEEEAYNFKKPYEDRFDSDLYEEISCLGKSGFKYLSKKEYDKINGLNAGSNTFFDLTNVFGVHEYEFPVKTKNDLILNFLKNEINILDLTSNYLEVKYSIPLKGKGVVAVYSLRTNNMLLYGSNTGKIYIQELGSENSKPLEVDDCKSACYDIVVDETDKFVFVCGMGYLKVYELNNKKLDLISELNISARSISLTNDLVILNKGMHGIELYNFNGIELIKRDSLDVGFSVDVMRLNRVNDNILVSSKPVGKLGLIKITQPKKNKLFGNLFKFK